MVDSTISNKIKETLNDATNVLVLGHANPRPDGDSLGSVLAMTHYLRSMGKAATAYAVVPAAPSLAYLPGSFELTTDVAKLTMGSYDVIVALDFSELKNSGLEEELRVARQRGVKFINIDHHPGEHDIGGVELVVPTASSTAELLCELLVGWRATITPDMATCLLTGILTDTQNFTNGATTFMAMQAGAELLRSGARLRQITAHTWQNKDLPILRLWGKVLLRLQEDKQTGIATTVITLQDLAEENLPAEAAEGVANFLNSLSTSKAILVLREEVGSVKGSLRTVSEDVDVSIIAKQYGGGGHKKAAGFLIPGHIVQTADGWKIVE